MDFVSPVNELGPQIRLAVCAQCRTIEEIPDFAGHPDNDVLLKITAEKHTNALGVEHPGAIIRVPISAWSRPDVKEQIVKQIRDRVSGGLDDADKGFYDTRSTFHDDALTCFNKHLRPKGQCPDYMDDSKKLLPNTKAERKDLGLQAPTSAGVHIHLCRFCPVHVYNMTRAKEAAGLYK